MESAIQQISRGVSEIISVEVLSQKIAQAAKSRRKLRVKAGFDPTAPDIHLGHVVLLRKLRQFQDLGHQVFFLIGDFTAQIGDPTGRNELRPKMDRKTIEANARTYKSQVFKVLDEEKTEVVFNSSWLAKMTSTEILQLAQHSTVAQMLARADFKRRFEEKKEISILEFMYPLLQGYDSVFLKVDIELGGADQKFNLLMGRHLQEIFGQPPQAVVMTPLLEGTDGVYKMSKSLGNYIGVNESAKEIFGKVMSISDELMWRYYELLTSEDLSQVKKLHPKEAKLRLGENIVSQFYSVAESQDARQQFEKTFSQKTTPDDVVEFVFKEKESISLVDLLLKAKLVSSKNEARRLVNQGAVVYEGDRIDSEDWLLKEGVLKVGKRRFLKLVKKT